MKIKQEDFYCDRRMPWRGKWASGNGAMDNSLPYHRGYVIVKGLAITIFKVGLT
ncbi:hypothetical protein [Paenibacillus agricola]|uniref:Uncharacterized protein n=1 Tax=Paenibacillus agricola TaxID=2716264 RepID=A0ABX0JCH8_9BACL|nr:hypothetical protein [Paenibacillus agricola]NHN34207.1 hypothetical protein [Paenibacillus agricola]